MTKNKNIDLLNKFIIYKRFTGNDVLGINIAR